MADLLHNILFGEVTRPVTQKMWLCDTEDSHFVCPCCHEYALLDWAGAPVASKYCPFCGTMLEPWDGKARYTKDKV